jgi:hypothetical protein
MLLRKNHRHTGMDLRHELIRLACDNRASAQPLPRFGIFPVFPEPGKGERASVFHGDRERQLRFSRFAPFVKSVRRNQASSFAECLPERGRFIDGLSSGRLWSGKRSLSLSPNKELIPTAGRRAIAVPFPD